MRPIPGIPVTALALMRERDFRVIWSVGILAEFGRRNELLVWSLLLFKVIEAPASFLMLLWVFNNLPRPFVSPIAGYIADRFSRQQVMLLVQAANLVTTAGLLALLLYDLDYCTVLAHLRGRIHSGDYQGHRRPITAHGHFRHCGTGPDCQRHVSGRNRPERGKDDRPGGWRASH